MALDPSIILGGHPVQQANPLEMLSTISQIQGIREQTEARRLAADKARQDAADQAAIRNVFAATNGDVDKALPELYKVSPRAAAVFEEQVNKARKEGFEKHKSEVDLSSKQLDLGIKLLQGATDQQSYDVVLPMIGTMAPDIAKAMGPTYDPARVQQFLQVGLTQKDIYDRRKDALQLFTDGKAHEAVGTYLSTARSADEWNGFKAGAKAQGVPAGIVDAYGDYSPENVARAATVAISPSKRAELAGQAETRAQTERHQTVQEQLQAGQLAVSRGQLAVAQAREKREGGASGVKLTATQQEDISTMLTVEQLANDVQAIDKKVGGLPGVGPVVGHLPASLMGVGGATGEELRNKIGNIQGTIAKLRGGTSFTPSEQKLLDSYTPTVTDTDAAIRTKLATLVDFIQKKRENTLRVARGEYTLPTDTKTTTTTTTAKTNPFRK